MLKYLHIANFAVVNEVSIEFGEGLNLLTGETGSGKSIVVDSLSILLGGKATTDIIRTGSDVTMVEGVFSVEHNLVLALLADEAGIDVSDGELIIRREVSDRNRGRTFLNDRLVTVSLLKKLRPLLVDIHGQGDQQSLLDADLHVDVLDRFAGLEEPAALVKTAYETCRALERELDALRRSEAERLRTVDVLKFQIDEIRRLDLQPHEDETLKNEREILLNSEKLSQLCSYVYDAVYENSEAVLTVLAQVEKRVSQLSRFETRFDEKLEELKTAQYTLQELAYFVRDFGEGIQFSAERLSAVEGRLAEISRLKRKYGADVEEILAALEGMERQFSTLQDYEEEIRSLTSRLDAARAEYETAARALSERRVVAAADLEEKVNRELQELAMETTRFSVGMSVADASASGLALREKGIDRVEFRVAQGHDEPARPLARVASGGELSRLMLALKVVSTPTEVPKTLVFDEVDVGIGGRVAEAVGQRLSILGRTCQVLCVTHQAQIARFADHHFTVEKRLEEGRVETRVAALDRNGRIEELARMLGGSDITGTTRRHARELLQSNR